MGCYYCKTEDSKTYKMTISDKQKNGDETRFWNFRLISLDLCSACISNKVRSETEKIFVRYMIALPLAYLIFKMGGYLADFLSKPFNILVLLLTFGFIFLVLIIPGADVGTNKDAVIYHAFREFAMETYGYKNKFDDFELWDERKFYEMHGIR